MKKPDSNPSRPSPFSTPTWNATDRRDPTRARLVRAIWKHRDPMYACYRELRLPARPQPICLGALLLVWDRWEGSRGACPSCGSLGLMTGAAGVVNVGSLNGVCIGCSRILHRRTAGIVSAMNSIRSSLAGTLYDIPFVFSSGWSVGGKATGLVAALQEVGAEGLKWSRRARL